MGDGGRGTGVGVAAAAGVSVGALRSITIGWIPPPVWQAVHRMTATTGRDALRSFILLSREDFPGNGGEILVHAAKPSRLPVVPADMGLLSGLLAAAAFLSPAPEPSAVTVPEVLGQFDRVCARPFWPGFDPCRIPVVIFDGKTTWLFRHPAPPAEFLPAAGNAALRTFEGRHASVRANTSVDLAGTWSAAAIFPSPARNAKTLAALLVHEAFHVFQGKKHPRWGANEADLFLYPTEGARPLALRRLESIALRRALGAGNPKAGAGWASRAVQVRRERFALLPAAASGYERGTEMKEGLARYVQWLAGGTDPLFPAAEFPASAVRDRAYSSGAAMALLLDALDPGWKRRVEEKEPASLEELLAASVGDAAPLSFERGEAEREERRAASEAAAASAERDRRRREFLDGPGWKIVLEPAEPLQAEGFDPLNVERLAPAEVLHTRFVKLANSAGSIEVLGRRCLTESAGKHPLFEGVRRVTIELPSPPRIEENGETIRISGGGVTLEYRGRLTSRGQVYIIH